MTPYFLSLCVTDHLFIGWSSSLSLPASLVDGHYFRHQSPREGKKRPREQERYLYSLEVKDKAMKMKVTTSIRPGLEHSLPNPYLSSLLLCHGWSFDRPWKEGVREEKERYESRS